MDRVNYFPRGLCQPEGSFRFSAEALLLASFVRLNGAETSFADFGTGCGVVGLAVLLRAFGLNGTDGTNGTGGAADRAGEQTISTGLPGLNEAAVFKDKLSGQRGLPLQGTGYEISPELCAAARENAEALGMGRYFRVMEQDLAAFAEKSMTNPLPGSEDAEPGFDFIVANPPYRLLSEGRAPASPLRRLALFEEKGSMRIFAAAAARMLRDGGSFYCVYPVRREAYLLALLSGLGLRPRRLLRVYAQPGKLSPFFLLQACKDNSNEFNELSKIVLYSGSTVTSEALEFCPFLRCNQSRTGGPERSPSDLPACFSGIFNI